MKLSEFSRVALDAQPSKCRGCGKGTRGPTDLLCKRCWSHVTPEAHARYLQAWHAAIAVTPSVPIAMDDPRMQRAVDDLVASRMQRALPNKKALVLQAIERHALPVAAPSPIGTMISMAALERLHLAALLLAHDWHQGEVATILHLNPKSVYRMMRLYGLHKPRNGHAA